MLNWFGRFEENLVNGVVKYAVLAEAAPSEIANGASHGVNFEETIGGYAEGIPVGKYPSRRQHKLQILPFRIL